MSILSRQKVLLYLLSQAGGTASRLEATKWCFLVRQKTPSRGGATFYRFVPYLYGPFSFCLYHEASKLESLGLLQQLGERAWRVTGAGTKEGLSLGRRLRHEVDSIFRRYRKLRLDDLLDSIYAQFPWFTINSRMNGRRAVSRPRACPAVYTIGYEGLLVDDFLNRLLHHGMHRLIDVRSNPVARRYGFHKSSLSRLCKNLQIDYEHIPQLGIPSQYRRNLQSKSDYDMVFAEYREKTLDSSVPLVRRVAESVRQEATVLVCNEADPAFCHRSHLAERVSEIIQQPVKHLEWPR